MRRAQLLSTEVIRIFVREEHACHGLSKSGHTQMAIVSKATLNKPLPQELVA
jgi:hypothetical protein